MENLAKEFAQLRKEKVRTEEKLVALNKQLDQKGKQLMEAMLDKGITQFKLKGVGLIYISTLVSPKITDIETFYKFLKDNDQAFIIKETVHSKTLYSWYKQWMEKEGEDNQEANIPGLEVFEKPLVKLNKG